MPVLFTGLTAKRFPSHARNSGVTELPQKAVILARGLGTRMRAEVPELSLTADQERLAGAGIKALIPVAGGKTLLELISQTLTTAGFTNIFAVIGPEHGAIRDFCTTKGLNISFVVQNEPLGTADAVLAAEGCIDSDELFLVVNSDNLYPVESLRKLRETNCPALLAFDREALVERSNIDVERIAKFATIEIDDRGFLRRVIEKPNDDGLAPLVSMNAWLFSPAIFAACRAIRLSERGELEITSAVQYAIDELGEEFVAVETDEGVLDLSSRSDIETVGQFLSKKIHDP